MESGFNFPKQGECVVLRAAPEQRRVVEDMAGGSYFAHARPIGGGRLRSHAPLAVQARVYASEAGSPGMGQCSLRPHHSQ